jgi:hypothetical protein
MEVLLALKGKMRKGLRIRNVTQVELEKRMLVLGGSARVVSTLNVSVAARLYWRYSGTPKRIVTTNLPFLRIFLRLSLNQENLRGPEKP